MPNYQTTKETEILGGIAEILFGSHHANITRAHSSGKIIGERMHLLMESPYWDHIQPQPIEKQITKKGYQPTQKESESLKSLCHYIEGQIQILCKKEATIAVLKSPEARKRGNSKTLGVLEENQNQAERYLTVLRGLFNDPLEQPTTLPTKQPTTLPTNRYPNPFRTDGVATYSYNNTRYSLRLIMAVVWCAASDENAKWIHTFDQLSKEEATLNSKENFISVLSESLRAYNQDNGPNSFNSADNPSCDLGTIERLLLRGAAFNKCFLPPESEDQPNKLFEIKRSLDHYLINELENFCKESDKALMFRVLSNKILMDEPSVPSDEAYLSIFERYEDFLIVKQKEQTKEDLYAYFLKTLVGFPWQIQSKAETKLKHYLIQLLQTRIGMMTSIELDDPNGLMNAENKSSLNRLLMLSRRAFTNDIWIENYQNIDDAKEFEQHRIGLKALEISVDTEYFRCALAPNLLYTNKTQQRFKKLWLEYQEKANQFTDGRGEKIKKQIDQLTKDKLKNEFAQEGNDYNTRHIISYTLASIDQRLQRLEKKCIEVTSESIETLYQASLETLWDHVSTEAEPLLSSIAPQGIRLNHQRYQQLKEKQIKQLAWSLHIANLAACFDQKGHVDRQRDIVRGIAAMLGRTLNSNDFEAETFEQDYFSEEDIEDVIWIACSVIRELDISAEQKKTAWSALENACKNNEVFSRYISLDYLLEKLHENLSNHDDNIWPKLLELFAKLEKGEETIGSDSWREHGKLFHRDKYTQNLTWFSLLSIMSSLKLGYLHIGNQQSLSLYCKLFHGDHASFNSSEEKSYRDIIVSGKLKCTIEGLASYLQKVVNLINPNQNFRSAFAEGIMAAIPRNRTEQLASTVQAFTEKSILCVRLSSSCPDQVAVTILRKDWKPYHILHSVKTYYEEMKGGFLGGIPLSGTHRIMPGGNFDHKALLEQQRKKYVRALGRYVKTCNSPGLGSALQNLDRYTPPTYSNLPSSKITLFSENSDNSLPKRETERGLRPG